MIDDGSFNFDMDHFIQGEIKFDEGDDAMCESCECVNCSCGKKYQSVRYDDYHGQSLSKQIRDDDPEEEKKEESKEDKEEVKEEKEPEQFMQKILYDVEDSDDSKSVGE
jgi:Na+-translocating ferredoxin:NAD+ oxidoreductase RnfC subunit